MNRTIKTLLKESEIIGNKYKLNTSFRFASALNGERYGNNAGSSLEFVDHREYQPGDDIRHIDWNAMARQDKPVIRVFREEVTPKLEIIIDGSLSMVLRESKKYEALIAMTNILCVAAARSGCNSSIRIIKETSYMLSSEKIINCDDKEFKCDFAGDSGISFVSYPPKFYPKSIRILLSDLFWNVEPATVLRALSNGSSMTVVIQVVAEKDENPDLLGNLRLIDSETSEIYEVIADETLINKYKHNYNLHRESWKNSCTSNGTVFTHIIAEKFLNDFIADGLIENMVLLPECKS